MTQLIYIAGIVLGCAVIIMLLYAIMTDDTTGLS